MMAVLMSKIVDTYIWKYDKKFLWGHIIELQTHGTFITKPRHKLEGKNYNNKPHTDGGRASLQQRL